MGRQSFWAGPWMGVGVGRAGPLLLGGEETGWEGFEEFLSSWATFSTCRSPTKDKVLVTQLCATLYQPMDYSQLGSSVHRILQMGILEWVAIPFFRGSFWSRDRTQVPWIVGTFCTTEPPGKPSGKLYLKQIEGKKNLVPTAFEKHIELHYNFMCACSVRLLFSFLYPAFLIHISFLLWDGFLVSSLCVCNFVGLIFQTRFSRSNFSSPLIFLFT